jgi:hypothetical protein
MERKNAGNTKFRMVPAYFSHSTVTLSTLLTNVDIQRSIRDTPIDIRF